MDRLALIEKSKYMFFGSGGHQGTADRFCNVDGSFSPAPRHSKMPVVLKAQMVNDDGKQDRYMMPSL